MNKILVKNEIFKSERLSDGSIVVTVLRDNNNFFGIDIEGCKFVTDKEGFVQDEFTEQATEQIKNCCKKKDFGYTEYELKIELRCRFLNTIMAML